MNRPGPVWEFAGRSQITYGVHEARGGTLAFPTPSRRLLRHTLLRSPYALRLQPVYAAGTGVRYVPPLTKRAHTVRASLLARATMTNIFGFRANICISHDPAGAPR
jgi:hypothetical protein